MGRRKATAVPPDVLGTTRSKEKRDTIKRVARYRKDWAYRQCLVKISATLSDRVRMSCSRLGKERIDHLQRTYKISQSYQLTSTPTPRMITELSETASPTCAPQSPRPGGRRDLVPYPKIYSPWTIENAIQSWSNSTWQNVHVPNSSNILTSNSKRAMSTLLARGISDMVQRAYVCTLRSYVRYNHPVQSVSMSTFNSALAISIDQNMHENISWAHRKNSTGFRASGSCSKCSSIFWTFLMDKRFHLTSCLNTGLA
jgi:hypothetical protein